MRAALTIAGSDSIAGAGIQADLKTFAALGVYGTTAVTAVTAQNTTGIVEMHALTAAAVRVQIETVAQDVRLAAVKTGMLASVEIVAAVADLLAHMHGPSLVVDPVMTASSPGQGILLPREAVETLKARLFPLATVVTPNVSEARALTGVDVRSARDAREAAMKIFDLGAKAVVVKGGHLEGRDAVDFLYDGRTMLEFSARRSPHQRVHGTGCTFASAIAAGLALGDDVPAAVQRAKTYVTGAIEHSLELGSGARLLNHFWTYTQR